MRRAILVTALLMMTALPTALAAAAAPPNELVTAFTGRAMSRWRAVTVDGVAGRISPMIYAEGDELNHHNVTLEFAGEGTVKVSVAHSADERWGKAIAKKGLHSRFREAVSGKPISVASPYKGELFAWVIVATEGDVTITSIRHACYRGKGTLYGHIPLGYEFAGAKLPYRLMLPPDYDPSRKYPLVISVAGSGSVGTKNRKNMEMVILARQLFTQYYDDDELACFSLVPQIPTDRAIPAPYHPKGPKGAPDRWHPSWPAVNAEGWFTQGTIALVRALVADPRLSIDPDRVYFTGFSYGGKACWQFLQAAPDLFAGAICGGGWPIGPPYSDPKGAMLAQLAEEVDVYSHIPVLIFAGAKDRMRFGSHAVHKLIQAAGGTSKYVEVPGVDHVPSASRGWGKRENIAWLFSQTRPKTSAAAQDNAPADPDRGAAVDP